MVISQLKKRNFKYFSTMNTASNNDNLEKDVELNKFKKLKLIDQGSLCLVFLVEDKITRNECFIM